jgi:hypothetical protein
MSTEILYEILDRYKDKIPEKPNRPKSAPTINSEDDISSDENEDDDDKNTSKKSPSESKRRRSKS